MVILKNRICKCYFAFLRNMPKDLKNTNYLNTYYIRIKNYVDVDIVSIYSL